MAESLKVWFLSPEVAPFAKTGGLADVAGSLPSALNGLGVDVAIGLPFYRTVRERDLFPTRIVAGLEVPFANGSLNGDVFETKTEEGIPVYLFEREDLFDRPNLYGARGGDYYDNLERFTYFSHAALSFAKQAGLHVDVIHCHDWQTGLVPAYLRTTYRNDPFFSGTASLFTIHNIGYQGLFPREKLSVCGIPPSEYHPEGLEYWGGISLLKAGIVYSDATTTVSPRYSKEIQTPEFGFGMEGILEKRSDALYGILNGADYTVWDPSTDQHIKSPYSRAEMKGKKVNKAALIDEMGLDRILVQRPLLAFISRLSGQKGCDLLIQAAGALMDLGAGLVILGRGEEWHEAALRDLGEKHQGLIAVRIGFDDSLAHRIIAGADILLIPSRYEPCGLTQMYALRYGTVPVVRATGGLDDTISGFDPGSGEGNGFKFAPYEPQALVSAVRQALDLYADSASWQKLMANAMRADFSWDRSAERYVEVYRSIRRP
jgi:starch synthase